VNRELPAYRLILLFTLLLPGIFQTPGNASSLPEPTVPKGYPVLLHKIGRPQADYKTPENTAAASLSALLGRDLDWYLQTLTAETAAQEKKTFQSAGIPMSKLFDLANPADEIYLTGKMPYKDGLIITSEIRCHDIDGTILKGHSGYLREDGLWKKTNKFSGDENLDRYNDVTYTSCIAGYDFGPEFLEDSCWHGNDLSNYNNTRIVLDKRYDEDLTVAVFDGDNGLACEHLKDMPVERLSVGGWFKADKIAHSAGFVAIGQDRNDSTAIVLDPGMGLRCWLHAGGGRVEGGAAGNYDFHDNQWHHVYLTYDGAEMKLYVDGRNKDSRPAAGPIDSAPVLNIGYCNATGNDGEGSAFEGRLDDIQIYNRALTAEEIGKKFKNGTTQSL